MKLLVVDSDRDLVNMLANWLKTLGFEVHRASTIEHARAEWLTQLPDFVIIEALIKGVDTVALCRDMRHKHDAFIIVIAEGRNVQDEVRYLDAGADDYLRKPFFPSQLLAHIHAVSRRSRTTIERRPSSVITVGPIRVDTLHNEVSVYGKISRLTPTESKLLHMLAVNANDVCTAEQIVTGVWGYNGHGDASLIKAHIRHLRQKLELDPSNPRYILTVPGVGYTLVRGTTETEGKELSSRSLHALSV